LRSLIGSCGFGHERDAVEGATTARRGVFERAHGGTVFLADLGELSMHLQPKLLQLLEQREVQRIGGTRSMRVDTRIVAAATQDLQVQVAKGQFREDLHVKLAGVLVPVPPLCERKEDIPLLAKEFGREFGGDDFQMQQTCIDSLMVHDWPGNIGELKNVVERGMHLLQPSGAGAVAAFDAAQSYRVNKERWNDDFERRYLEWLLEQSGGNVSRAARRADMDRKYLHKLLKKHLLKT